MTTRCERRQALTQESAKNSKVVLILNPIAGKGNAGRHEHEAVAALRGAGFEVDLQETKAPGHATELAREAAASGERLIVAAGGDGTVHETALGMWDTDAVLGVLPMGSGNDFARTHRIPFDLAGAVRTIREGRDVKSDVGVFNEWKFFNTMGIGFTVDVSLKSRTIRGLRGIPLYLLAVFKSLRSYRSIQLDITAPDFHRGSPTYFITTAIGICEGGGFVLTPDAAYDDGQFDLCIVDDISVMTALKVLPKAMKGKHTDHPAVTMHRTPNLNIISEHPMTVHADGQIYETGATRFEVECLAERLNVRVPGA